MMLNATHAKQAEEVREISAITYGFMASKALFAAVESTSSPALHAAPIYGRAGTGNGHRGEPTLNLLTALKSLGLAHFSHL